MANNLLSEDQLEAIEAIKSWYLSDITKPFRLSGVAGSGKSTVTAALVDLLKIGIIFCAPTGKAAAVLRNKGVAASTIHSTIYKPKADYNLKKITYELVDKYSFTNDIFIIDEASMVDEELRRDLEFLGKKVIYVGDPFQLPPVGNSSNHMQLANFSLTKLHRFAENNPIYTLSHHIRNGGNLKYGVWGKGVERKIQSSLIKPHIISQYDMVLCGYNRTRAMINNMMRDYYKKKGIIDVGERLIITKNATNKGLANGSMATVLEVGKETKSEHLLDLEVMIDSDIMPTRITIDTHHLYGINISKEARYNKSKFRMTLDKNRVFVDYGYCLTVHKAQGSEYDSVLLIEEPIGDTIEEKSRWLYTGITRAKKKLTIGA